MSTETQEETDMRHDDNFHDPGTLTVLDRADRAEPTSIEVTYEPARTPQRTRATTRGPVTVDTARIRRMLHC